MHGYRADQLSGNEERDCNVQIHNSKMSFQLVKLYLT